MECELKKKLYGKDHQKVAITLNNIGCTLKSLNKLEEAVLFHKQALRLRKNAVG